MTILDSLRTVSIYPIPNSVIKDICYKCGINPTMEANRNTRGYKRALSELYLWLAEAPQVSQAGVSYRITNEQRRSFLQKSADILLDLQDGQGEKMYGLKGRLL